MKKLTIMAAVLFGLSFAACNNEPGNNGENGDPASVTIRIAEGGTYAMTDDEVDGTAAENKIEKLELYVFNDAATPDPLVGTAAAPGYVSINVDATSQFKQQLVVTSGTGKIFAAVANMNIGNVANYAELKEKVAGTYAAANPLKADAGKFEMSGEKSDVTIAAGTTSFVTVNVSRLASKVEAPVTTGITFQLSDEEIAKLWDDATGITNASLSFVFDGFTVVNGLDKSDLFFIGNSDGNDRKIVTATGAPDWGLWKWDGKTYVKSVWDATGFYTKTYPGAVNGDFFLDGSEGQKTVYFYENKPQRVTHPTVGSDANTVYSMMVRGTVSTTVAGKAPVTRYWRVNFTREDFNHSFRNTAYSVKINILKTAGHPTPEEAEKENPVIPDPKDSIADITVKVNKWRINTFEDQM